MSGELTEAVVAALRDGAREAGLPRFGVTALEDETLRRSQGVLQDFLRRGFHGEMQFLEVTATMRGQPSTLLEGARAALVVAVPYGGEGAPIARYAQWADYHTIVHRRLERVVQHLEALVPGAQTKICVDTKPVPERTLAMRAGLGFQGKNGCLIVPGLGSYVVLGVILTDARLPGVPSGSGGGRTGAGAELRRGASGEGVPWDACGACRACLDACPTDAFVSPALLDARRCISYLTIEHRGPISDALADGIGERVAGCDVCQEVCPHNASPAIAGRSRPEERLPAVPGERDRALSLSALSNVGNNQHKGFVRGSALNRIPRRALRRNALIALGNRTRPLSEDERGALDAAVKDPDAELRRWAHRAQDRRAASEGDAGAAGAEVEREPS